MFGFCQLKDLLIELSIANAKRDAEDDADGDDDDGVASCFPPSPLLLANC